MVGGGWGEGGEVWVGGDGGGGVFAEVEKVVREDNGEREGDVVDGVKGGEERWEDEDLADELESDEEDLRVVRWVW